MAYKVSKMTMIYSSIRSMGLLGRKDNNRMRCEDQLLIWECTIMHHFPRLDKLFLITRDAKGISCLQDDTPQ